MERNLPQILLHPIQSKCRGFSSELKPELKPRHLFWIGGVVCSHTIHGELLHVCYSHLQLLLGCFEASIIVIFVFLEIVNLMPRFLCFPYFVKCFPDSWHFSHDHTFPSSCNVFLDITPTTIARMLWRSINAATFDMIISVLLVVTFYFALDHDVAPFRCRRQERWIIKFDVALHDFTTINCFSVPERCWLKHGFPLLRMSISMISKWL